MKKKELKKLDKVQLDKKLIEIRKDLMKLNAQKASGTPPENPGRIRSIKRTIARILTYSKQKKTKEVKNK